MTAQPGFTYHECSECGFDAVTKDSIAGVKTYYCPLCAGDTGRDVSMQSRPATTEDINIEGVDARIEK